MTRQGAQRRHRVVGQQGNVLFADALLAFVFAAGLADAALVIDQRRDALAGESPGPGHVPGLFSRSVDEHHGRTNVPMSRKHQGPG